MINQRLSKNLLKNKIILINKLQITAIIFIGNKQQRIKTN